MKLVSIIISLVILPLFTFSQTDTTQTDTFQVTSQPDTLGNDSNTIYAIAEQAPLFPGGPSEMYRFIGQHIQYPAEARDNNIQGRVYVSFVVEVDGSITDVRIIRGLSPECDAEVIRVIKLMPNWQPGEQKGKKVRVRYNLPVVFTLEGKKPKKKKRN